MILRTLALLLLLCASAAAQVVQGPGSNSGMLRASAITANAQLDGSALPGNSFLLRLLLRETAGHSVNVALGTTLGASDVMTAVTVPASGTMTVDITSAFLVNRFSATATQLLYVTSAAWNSASINAQLDYEVGP